MTFSSLVWLRLKEATFYLHGQDRHSASAVAQETTSSYNALSHSITTSRRTSTSTLPSWQGHSLTQRPLSVRCQSPSQQEMPRLWLRHRHRTACRRMASNCRVQVKNAIGRPILLRRVWRLTMHRNQTLHFSQRRRRVLALSLRKVTLSMLLARLEGRTRIVSLTEIPLCLPQTL